MFLATQGRAVQGRAGQGRAAPPAPGTLQYPTTITKIARGVGLISNADDVLPPTPLLGGKVATSYINHHQVTIITTIVMEKLRERMERVFSDKEKDEMKRLSDKNCLGCVCRDRELGIRQQRQG